MVSSETMPKLKFSIFLVLLSTVILILKLLFNSLESLKRKVSALLKDSEKFKTLSHPIPNGVWLSLIKIDLIESILPLKDHLSWLDLEIRKSLLHLKLLPSKNILKNISKLQMEKSMSYKLNLWKILRLNSKMMADLRLSLILIKF